MSLSEQHIATMRAIIRSVDRTKGRAKPPGRPINYAKHERIVAAVEKVSASRFGNMAVLACDLGYAHSDSLRQTYRRSKAILVRARRLVAEADPLLSEKVQHND